MSDMGSLQQRLAARRHQLQQARTFVLPILGYEDLGLAARYRVLSYEELRKIGKQNERQQDTAEGELAAASDTLINACVELVEQHSDGSEDGLGHVWSPVAVRELFGLELPDGTTARMALRSVLPSTQLMLHFQAYDVELSRVTPEIDREVGEALASVG